MVDEAALLRNLENGHVKGAALDVLDADSAWSEHLDAEHPLLKYAQMNENLLLTPHMGGYGIDSIRKTRDFVTNKLLNRINS
jgi:D-3-phosphoglycerate dehydrogenase